MPSPAIEDYIQAIYRHWALGEPAIGARIAHTLKVSAPTVTEMLRRMMREGLVEMTERKEVLLTQKGQELAQTLIRRHRLAERFLTDVLGMPWHTVHEEAHKFEHAMSPEVERRLSLFLGDPDTCPHGYPIPGNADCQYSVRRPLDTFPPGSRLQVGWVLEEPELLAYLAQVGLTPGVLFTLEEVAPFQSSFTLDLQGRRIVVGRAVAAKVWVSPSEREAPVPRTDDLTLLPTRRLA